MKPLKTKTHIQTHTCNLCIWAQMSAHLTGIPSEVQKLISHSESFQRKMTLAGLVRYISHMVVLVVCWPHRGIGFITLTHPHSRSHSHCLLSITQHLILTAFCFDLSHPLPSHSSWAQREMRWGFMTNQVNFWQGAPLSAHSSFKF